jgi:hypothetical protein
LAIAKWRWVRVCVGLVKLSGQEQAEAVTYGLAGRMRVAKEEDAAARSWSASEATSMSDVGCLELVTIARRRRQRVCPRPADRRDATHAVSRK